MTSATNPEQREQLLGFQRRVPLRKDRKHSWESHAVAGSLMKDVLHTLDLLAANDKTQFIFASLPAILKMCNQRRSRNKLPPCKMRQLKRILALLYDLHIVSHYFKSWDGRYGFVFEPHDGRCCTLDKHGNIIRKKYSVKMEPQPDGGVICVKHAYRGMPPYGTLGEPPEGHRRDTAQDTMKTPARTPVRTPQDAFEDTTQDTIRDTGDSSQLTNCVELTDEQVTEWLAEHAQWALSKVRRSVSLDKVGKVLGFKGLQGSEVSNQVSSSENEPQGQGQPRPEKQPQSQNQQPESFPSLRPTDLTAKATPTPAPMKVKNKSTTETIGEFFLGCTSLIETITDCELDADCISSWSEDDKDALEDCMEKAIAAKATRPYCGRLTLASLMGDTMKLLMETYEKEVPKPWVPVMRLLRERPPRTADVAPWKPGEFVIADQLKSGRVPCGDRLWLRESERESQGYAVKDEFGVWQKPTPDEAAVMAFAAELAKREPCPGCGIKHTPPFCKGSGSAK